MKCLLMMILFFASIVANGQSILIPGKKSFEKKWIKNNSYQMTWYGLKDNTKFEIGTVSTQIITSNNKLTLVTQVAIKNINTPWVDSSVAELKSLKPSYHSSFNMQREMALHFGTVVTGFYNDKVKMNNTIITDTTKSDYFDSNLYPYLISILPLAEGYEKEISIYDYNPSAKIGVIKAFVKQVKSGTYQSLKSGTRDVWVVTVSDEIGNGENGISIYYFDKAERKLWKQEINAGARSMVMIVKE